MWARRASAANDPCDVEFRETWTLDAATFEKLLQEQHTAGHIFTDADLAGSTDAAADTAANLAAGKHHIPDPAVLTAAMEKRYAIRPAYVDKVDKDRASTISSCISHVATRQRYMQAAKYKGHLLIAAILKEISDADEEVLDAIEAHLDGLEERGIDSIDTAEWNPHSSGPASRYSASPTFRPSMPPSSNKPTS